MAGLIQKAVNSLFVKDSDTSRVRDNIVTALNPVLTFLISNFAQNGPVLQVLKALQGTSATFTGSVQAGSLATLGAMSAGSAIVSGDLSIVNGNVTIRTRTGNGVVIVPAGGSPAFYITNAAGTIANFIVNEDGSASTVSSFTANSLVSSRGFKSFIPLGTQFRQPTQGGIVRTIDPVINTNNNSLAYITFNHTIPHAGSIVGISMYLDRTCTADVTVQITLNNGTMIDVMGVRAGTYIPSPPITFPKGQYTFPANAILGAACYVGTGYTFVAKIGIIVEFGA